MALNQRDLVLDFWVRFPSLTLVLISVSLYGSECRPLARKRHQNKHLDFDLVLGWVEGFRAGFTVHDELLGVPEKG